ncbi:hypothetical protein QNH20_05585 [Neobacillus sp. WH10]|uniref:hypothetical protein n=1 Tax=Neobacillus sp. WH10 TaxID=3047873 RepID=UPI0024C12D05|nr:hypothetical protein [Neobacillus sp. WH10]WHY78618.1 hypothetical protein QNH20_05585 [Neobacillus sp. WH10]
MEDDFSRWNIEKQNEDLLNHNTVVIKGTLSKYAKIKHESNSFRFLIDKDTGILIKYETYNETGNVVNYLHPIELIIIGPINTKNLSPNLIGLSDFSGKPIIYLTVRI